LLTALAACADAECVAGLVPQEVGFDRHGALFRLRDAQQFRNPFLAAAVVLVLHGDDAAVGGQHNGVADLLLAVAGRGDARFRVVQQPLVIVDEGREDHARTSRLSGGGTSIRPPTMRARKKRGVMPSAKSMSCSIQPRSRSPASDTSAAGTASPSSI